MANLLASGLIGAFVLIAYTILSRFRANKRAYHHGCEPLPHYKHKDPIFGLDLTIKTIRDVIGSRNLISLAERFRIYGSTFQSTTLGISTIWSIDSRLVQYTYHENDKDWGVAPFRQEPMEPFCGRGFITTDGPVWEHSRALMKPNFYKANISDLGPFGTFVDTFLTKIPRDGSTIDLQPLLFTLVILSTEPGS